MSIEEIVETYGLGEVETNALLSMLHWWQEGRMKDENLMDMAERKVKLSATCRGLDPGDTKARAETVVASYYRFQRENKSWLWKMK